MSRTARHHALARAWAALALAAGLAACGAPDTPRVPTPDQVKEGGVGQSQTTPQQKYGSVFGPGGLNLFGGGEAPPDGAPGVGMAVNGYLWRATLDTLSFMPLASADPFGGVIITDWFTPPESRNERFKATVYILTRQLRADGIRVAVFRQVRDHSDAWVDAEVTGGTAKELENAILSRARELRVAGTFK